MKVGVGQRALAIAAFGLNVMASAAPAAADTASEIRALKARLNKLEADEARARREAKVVHVALPADKGPPPPPPPLHWYERLSLRGYTQMRYNDILSGGPNWYDIRTTNDRSVGDRQNFFIRRARIILSGDVSDHLYLYFQNDFASSPPNANSTSATFAAPTATPPVRPSIISTIPSSPFQATTRSAVTPTRPATSRRFAILYADIYFDKDKEFRVRAGQSKIPYGFENMQSSQNRLALDRADAINTCCKDERDIGLFFYYTPKEMRHLFRDLVKNNLKGSGDYGMVGFGV